MIYKLTWNKIEIIKGYEMTAKSQKNYVNFAAALEGIHTACNVK